MNAVSCKTGKLFLCISCDKCCVCERIIILQQFRLRQKRSKQQSRLNGISLVGDGRCDSPGFSATFGNELVE